MTTTRRNATRKENTDDSGQRDQRAPVAAATPLEEILSPEMMAKITQQVVEQIMRALTQVQNLPPVQPNPQAQVHQVPMLNDPVVLDRPIADDKERRNLLIEFQTLRPSTFDGKSDHMAADMWFSEMNKHLNAFGVTGPMRVALAVHQLVGPAYQWWEMIMNDQDIDISTMTWEQFKILFYDNFFSEAIMEQLQREFIELTQKTMTVTEYKQKFIELSRFYPEMVRDERFKAYWFARGLRMEIRKLILPLQLTTLRETVVRAQLVEQELNFEQVLKNKNKRLQLEQITGASQKRQNMNEGYRTPQNQNHMQNKNRPEEATPQYQQNQLARPNCAIGEEMKKARRQGLCFHCEQRGHMARNCPTRSPASAPPQ